ncbi:MAG: hypothetical protein MJZ07_07465 [Bacteroidales bacterium]|nr:hypothetical protein [Bacteroidales bacterium]
MTKFFRTILSIAAIMLALTSCNKKQPERLRLALVTIESTESGVNIQLDDTTALRAPGLSPDAFKGKKIRAIINYFKDNSEGALENDIKLVAIDTIRTKMAEPDLGEANDETYGDDHIEIVNDWVTIGEDGYLTLRIRTYRDDPRKDHYVHLIDKGFKDGKYCFELRHNAQDDEAVYYADGLIAFNLNELAPVDRTPVILNLNWEGFSGPKKADVKLTFRQR